MGWKVNWWAKLQDGNHAYKLIQNQLTPIGNEQGSGGTYNNLFDAHPPFQIDGNFGCTSGITEMLMQSSDGAIHLLPALPDVWQSGIIMGLKARGGFEIVELKWDQGKITRLVVKSELGGNLRLRLPNNLNFQGDSELNSVNENTPNSNPFYYTDEIAEAIISEEVLVETFQIKPTILVEIDTKIGESYLFTIN